MMKPSTYSEELGKSNCRDLRGRKGQARIERRIGRAKIPRVTESRKLNLEQESITEPSVTLGVGLANSSDEVG